MENFMVLGKGTEYNRECTCEDRILFKTIPISCDHSISAGFTVYQNFIKKLVFKIIYKEYIKKKLPYEKLKEFEL